MPACKPNMRLPITDCRFRSRGSATCACCSTNCACTELCWRVQFRELVIGFTPLRKLCMHLDALQTQLPKTNSPHNFCATSHALLTQEHFQLVACACMTAFKKDYFAASRQNMTCWLMEHASIGLTINMLPDLQMVTKCSYHSAICCSTVITHVLQCMSNRCADTINPDLFRQDWSPRLCHTGQ